MSQSCVDLIGCSGVFMETVRLIERIARTDAPVLIEGETGTGKEVAARAIHYGGARRDRPFVPVNCGAIPENLVENELFGHTRGAFTDAREPQPGLVSLANGGTLFLDEVDALSAKGQVTLLRFLQDFSYRPLGSRLEQRADVRVIAATNTRLQDLVDTQRFRVDLFYRLQILLLRLPPLRERHGDPPLLARHFVRALSARYQVPELRIDPGTIPLLDAYHWPGNIRELENLIHREFLMAEDASIRISPSILGLVPAPSRAGPAAVVDAFAQGGFRQSKAQAIEAFEREFILQLLSKSRGNISLAARLCGKERRAFGKLLKKYGIERTTFVG